MVIGFGSFEEVYHVYSSSEWFLHANLDALWMKGMEKYFVEYGTFIRAVFFFMNGEKV